MRSARSSATGHGCNGLGFRPLRKARAIIAADFDARQCRCLDEAFRGRSARKQDREELPRRAIQVPGACDLRVLRQTIPIDGRENSPAMNEIADAIHLRDANRRVELRHLAIESPDRTSGLRMRVLSKIERGSEGRSRDRDAQRLRRLRRPRTAWSRASRKPRRHPRQTSLMGADRRDRPHCR